MFNVIARWLLLIVPEIMALSEIVLRMWFFVGI
jgi:hypothetical protein